MAYGAPRATRYDVVIVGSGHGGAQAAIALRQAKSVGSIGMVGAEPDLPYERPPLSKDYFAGNKPLERILIRQEAFWQEREVAIHLNTRVESIDTFANIVNLSDGGTLGYDKLIWAAGGDARRLSCDGGEAAGVHTIRTRADVDQLLGELPDVETAVVVGGGYIGLEAASALTKFGKNVILLEVLDRVLARVAGEELSRFYETEHRAHGVDVRLNIAIDAIETAKDKNGRVIALDCVNAVKDYVQGKRLIDSMITADLAALADASKPLKEQVADRPPN